MRHFISNINKARVVVVVLLPMVSVLVAIYLSWMRYVFPLDIALLVVFYLLAGIGVTIGYHRLLTHQSFETHNWIKGLLLILGSMALMGRPDRWAATHIDHHAHSDEEGDPHSPLEGFWHAHMGWMLRNENSYETDIKKFTPHLLEDRTVQFVSDYQWLWISLSFGLPFLIGGWTGFIWGGPVRIFLGTHITWSVNSICHCFGRRDFITTDDSRNHWLIGLIGFGEGWHNNHHAFPRSPYHGLHWWQFDPSAIIIRVMEYMGLAWNLQRVSREVAEVHKLRAVNAVGAIAEKRAQVLIAISQAKNDLEATMDRIVIEKVGDPAIEKMMQFHDETAKRLNQINRYVTKAKTMKKHVLEKYRLEVQELSFCVRQKMQQLKKVAV